ncbi:MAG: hypothetical protein D4R68_04770 [Ignavibacteriales bacterium]|nr:MAG: hypothetical protein D4R68_04770 [Ignavibacteriales bacterium]
MELQTEEKKSKSKYFLNILLSVACSIFLACIIPAIIGSLLGYRFDLQIYLEVFIQQHHDIAAWFEFSWPDILMPLGIIISYFIGGIIFYKLQKRSIPFNSSNVKQIVIISISFSIVTLIVVLLLAVLARLSEPFTSDLLRFIARQGVLQTITLLLLSSLMCGLGIFTAVKIKQNVIKKNNGSNSNI